MFKFHLSEKTTRRLMPHLPANALGGEPTYSDIRAALLKVMAEDEAQQRAGLHQLEDTGS